MKKIKVLFVLIVVFIFSCENNNKELIEVKQGFEKYIISYTRGEYLSGGAHFLIQLREPYSDTIVPGTPVGMDIFSFSPSVNGQTFWVNQRTIEFVPDHTLKSNTTYTIEIDLARLLDVPKEFSTMKYQVKTIAQSFSLGKGQLSTYPNEMKYFKYEGSVLTADLADNDAVEKAVEARFTNKALTLKWHHGVKGRIHTFTIDSIKRQEEGARLVISVNGQSIDVDYDEDMNERIPGINEFEVISAISTNGDNQHITITFSDPLLPDQDLKGLVYLDDNPNPNLSIEGNKILLSMNYKLKGKQRLHVNEGIKNALSYKLKESIEYELSFESIKPAVRLIGDGVIMPSSNGLIFPFEAVSLNAVDLKIVQIFEDNVLFFLQENEMPNTREISRVGRLVFMKKVSLKGKTKVNLNIWNTYKIDLSDYIEVQPGAIYHVELQFRKSYSTYKGEDDESAVHEFSDEEYAEEVEREMKSWDGRKYYWDWDYPDDYDWHERDNPLHSSYYNPDKWESKNIFVSDFGITAKSNALNKFFVAIADIKTTNPVADARVKFYNYQRQLIDEGKTDGRGMLFKNLKNKPYFVVVTKGNQVGYLKVDNGNSLSLSNFNVGGMVTRKGMKGYIYGERGVWRPGDNIYITFILEDKEDVLPDNYPIKFSLYNPLDQLIESRIVKYGEYGFYSFHTKTESDALTGNWTLRVKAGGADFVRTIKIETIKPNRIKAKIDFGTDMISREDLSKAFRLQANWLHGAPASDLKFDVKLKLKKETTEFKRFKQYNFDNAAADFSPEEKDIASGELNSEGWKDLSLNINSYGAPGELKAVFTTRIFEKSGDFSILTQRITYSPYDCYIGTRILSHGENGWYTISKKQRLGIVSVNNKGAIIPNRKVEVSIYKVRWHWWWDSYGDNLASYITNSSSSRVLHKYVSTDSKGKGSLDFKLPYNNWRDNGRYLIMVSDTEGNHISSFTAYFSEWYGSIGGQGEGATVLAFTSNKEKYFAGEEAEIIIPSSKSGRALVSLEKGSQVIDAFWVKTSQNETRFKIPITKEMAPNIFVHISLIQPHNQTINDNPIRMYGVIPIDVEAVNTRLKPMIKVDKKLEPEKKFTVEISEEKGREMTYTLAIVDEGLLDITGFRTPDPWTRFFSREALSIRTWDMYDYVIGAYGARLENAFAIGGGDEIKDPSKNKANRFKPVVIFKGPITLKAGEKKVHKFTMPNYIGSVRIMVVAGQNGAYGNAEKAVPVKKDLMILSTLPRVLGPNEEVKLPVTVFAMDKNVKDVRVSVSTNKKLTVVGSKTKKVHFLKQGEKMATFNLKVNPTTGKAVVHVTAISGKLKAKYDIELDVRNPNLPYTLIKDTILMAGDRWSTTIEPFGIEGSNSASIEVSSMPAINLEKRLDYLIHYPYGCIEQTVSSVLPQLFLDDLLDLTTSQKINIQNNVQSALNRLRLFQLPGGGFSYWPGQDRANLWGSNYAGHFLLLAREKGYALPAGMLNKWIRYEKSTANYWERLDLYGYDMNQAYRLYLLALAGKPELGAMNRLRESNQIRERARILLAGAYLLINQKVAAVKIMEAPYMNNTYVRHYYDYSYGSSTRDKAFKAMVLNQIGKRSEAFELIKEIADDLASQSWMSTQTTAISLMAVSDFFITSGTSKGCYVGLTIGNKKNIIKSNRNIITRDIPLKLGDKKVIKVENKTKGINYVRIMIKGAPAEGREIAKSDNLTLKVVYYDMSDHKINPDRIKQGTDFKAVVTVFNPAYLGHYHDMALSQVFPSGWEIINTRLYDIGGAPSQTRPDYQDIRDDRVLTFFDLKKYGTASFTVMLNAAYLGKFYMPATLCGAMYDNNIEAIIPGKWVEVVTE